jgi:hypothetical protein
MMTRACRGLQLGYITAIAVMGSFAAVHAADVPLPGKLLLIKNTKVT